MPSKFHFFEAFLSVAILQSILACGQTSFNGSTPVAAKAEAADSKPAVFEGSTPAIPSPVIPIETEVPVREPIIPEESDPPLDTTLFFNKNQANISEPQIITSGALNLSIDDVLDSAENEAAQVKPELAIYFVIDRSSSMGAELNTVKQGIQAFSDNLIASGFTASFAGNAFQDQIDAQFNLNSIDLFKTFVNGLTLGSSTGNGDFPEGSLAGLRLAVSSLSASVTDPDVVPVIVLFTDALGHNGGSGSDTRNRDCSSQAFLNQMNSEFGQRIIFFHSTSSGVQPANNSPASCSFQRSSDQFAGIQTAINAQTLGKYRGQALPFPFNDQVLTDQLPKLLVEKVVARPLACEVQEAKLKQGATLLKSWSRAEMSNLVSSDGGLFLPEALRSGETAARDGEQLTFTVDRCCERNADQSCKIVRQQTVNFQLKIRD